MEWEEGAKQGEWRLQGRHVVCGDARQRRIYVRELIDIGSYEFGSCTLSVETKLAIVESVGVEQVLAAMTEIASEKGRRYRPDIEGTHNLALLKFLVQQRKGEPGAMSRFGTIADGYGG